VDVDGDAAPVVGDGHRVVDVDRHRDPVGMPSQRFVDGVVDDFVDHVMQAGDVVRVPDVHAGALAHRIQSLEDFDVFCCVVFCHPRLLSGVLFGLFPRRCGEGFFAAIKNAEL
jgi:hypothetical protein